MSSLGLRTQRDNGGLNIRAEERDGYWEFNVYWS